jgi:hypothetical protein
MRIAGFNDRGEARIVDDAGRLVGVGELRIEDGHLTGIDPGDRLGLEIVITWTPQMPDPDQVDFDGLDWDDLLGPSR